MLNEICGQPYGRKSRTKSSLWIQVPYNAVHFVPRTSVPQLIHGETMNIEETDHEGSTTTSCFSSVHLLQLHVTNYRCARFQCHSVFGPLVYHLSLCLQGCGALYPSHMEMPSFNNNVLRATWSAGVCVVPYLLFTCSGQNCEEKVVIKQHTGSCCQCLLLNFQYYACHKQ